jgi:arylsulfatase A-like enzyme
VEATPRNVLVIVLDTVRTDRIGAWGNERGLTPNIDALAVQSTLFAHAYSNAGWTLPAHASLFTGQYPVSHRATQETLALGIDLPTLAEVFANNGWSTFGASANGVVSEANGLARGFQRFDETFRSETAARFDTSPHPNEGALVDFLDKNHDQPWFAFLNFIEAHLPYRPPQAFIDRVVDTERFSPEQVAIAAGAKMRDHYLAADDLPPDLVELLNQLYDAEIAALDEFIGHLLQTLADRNALDNTVLVVTSDHGENLGEHGHFSHVFDLHNTLVSVPLLIQIPGIEPGVRQDPVQLLDLFETLLNLNAIDFDGRTDGRDLFAANAMDQNPIVIAESYYPRQVLSVFTPEELDTSADRFAPFLVRQRVAQATQRKWWWRSNDIGTAYDLVKDPSELHDESDNGQPPHPWRKLATVLDEFVETYQGPVPLLETPPPGWLMPGFEQTIDDPELLERLRALGYVN